MSEQPVQNFQNHVLVPKSIIRVAVVWVAAIVLAIVGIFMSNVAVVGAATVVACVAGMLTAVMARQYSVKLQDRIIRLEMRVRMRQVLPDELAADIHDFSLSQLIGLRFASDDELPELSRKVLDENITAVKEIKNLVRDWQADDHRV